MHIPPALFAGDRIKTGPIFHMNKKLQEPLKELYHLLSS